MTEATQVVADAPQAEAQVATEAPATTEAAPAPEATPERASLLNQPQKVPEPEAEPEAEAVEPEAAEADKVVDTGDDTGTLEDTTEAEPEKEPEAETEEQVSEEEAESKAEEAEPEEAAAPSLEWTDIRDFMAGDNEMLQKLLGRYRSAQALANAFAKQRQEISRLQKENQMAPELPDNPTDEELAEYRKRLNIPEDVSDYKVEFGESFESSDADAPVLDTYREFMHENHVPPQYAQKTIEWYESFAESQRQAMNQTADETQAETVASLTNEWGKEYDGNLNAIRALLDNTIGGDGAKELRSARMADGSYLMNNANLLRLLAGPAVDQLGGVAMYAGDTAAGMRGLEDRKKELMGLILTDKEEYKSDRVQMEIREINEKLAKLGKL